MTTLFLHIGYPKTGTTSLQAFLAHNDRALRTRGILYPTSGRYDGAHHPYSFCIGVGGQNSGPEAVSKDDLLRALADEVASSGCTSVLLSSEYLVTCRRPRIVKDLFAGFDIRIVVYLRRHDLILESMFNQSTRTTASSPPLGIHDFIEQRMRSRRIPLDYLATLDRWAAVFGTQRMIVRPFERRQNQPNLYRDFLRSIGIEWIETLRYPKQPANVSISNRTLSVIEAVRKGDAGDALKQVLIARLIDMDAYSPARTRSTVLSPEDRARLVQMHEASYKAIAETYLGRADGRLFVESLSDGVDIEPHRPPTREEIDEMLHRAMTMHVEAMG